MLMVGLLVTSDFGIDRRHSLHGHIGVLQLGGATLVGGAEVGRINMGIAV